ncbi:short-chain dehydrogenase [Xylaria nigripes]|nr:short-chain dehydrogenase [Xylaria nigripes]
MAKYNKLVGKHIVVIGGSGDIGRAIVEAGIESSAHMTLVGSSQASADAAVSVIKADYPNGRVVGLGCDLSKATIEQDLDALLTLAHQLNGEIDHIILAASGNLRRGGMQDVTADAAFTAAQLLFIAPLILGKLGPKFLAGAANGRPGTVKNKSIVLTSGTISTKPKPNFAMASYFAAGINGLTRALALDLSPIRVNCVEPGPVNTSRWDLMFGAKDRDAGLQRMFSRLPVGKAATVDEVAEAYMYILRDSNATGETVRTGGGQHLI